MQTPERLMRTIIGHCDEVADYQGDRWCRAHTNTLVDGICPKADATLDLIRAHGAEVLREAAEAYFYDGDRDRPLAGYVSLHNRADRIQFGGE